MKYECHYPVDDQAFHAVQFWGKRTIAWTWCKQWRLHWQKTVVVIGPLVIGYLKHGMGHDDEG